MKVLSNLLKSLAVVCLIGLLITFGLLIYHYSFDPYNWLKAETNGVESRDLWNARRDLYGFLITAFFAGALVFGSYPLIIRLLNYRK